MMSSGIALMPPITLFSGDSGAKHRLSLSQKRPPPTASRRAGAVCDHRPMAENYDAMELIACFIEGFHVP